MRRSMGQLRSLLAQLVPEPAPVRPYVHPGNYWEEENVRLYADGMHKQYTPNLCTCAIAALTLGLYLSMPHILLGLLVGAFYSRTALAALLLLLGTLLLPAKPLRLPAVLRSYVFLCWRRYFKFSYLFEVNLDVYQDYIIAQFPHGAFPLGAVLGGSFMACTYPDCTCYALAADAAFWVPVWRHVHGWLGTTACTKSNFHRLLAKGVKGPLPHRTAAAVAGAGAPHANALHSCATTGGYLEKQQQQGERQGEEQRQQQETQEVQQAVERQQQLEVAAAAAVGCHIKPFSSSKSPFTSAAGAAAAAAAVDGAAVMRNSCGGDAAAAAAGAAAGVVDNKVPLGPFASASVLPVTNSSLTAALTEAVGALVGSSSSNNGGLGGTSVSSSRPPSRSVMVRRHTSSPALGGRLSAALSMTGSIFKHHHTLSDSESSDSESGGDEDATHASRRGQQQQGSYCACGSGLRCREQGLCHSRHAADPLAVTSAGGAAAVDGCNGGSSSKGSSRSVTRSNSASGALLMNSASGALVTVHAFSCSDSGSSSGGGSVYRSRSRSSSFGGSSVCSCCGACSVLAEVTSLPMEGSLKLQHSKESSTLPPPHKQQQQQQYQHQHQHNQSSLLTIPSDDSEAASGDGVAAEVLGEGAFAAAAAGSNVVAADAAAALELSESGDSSMPLLGQQVMQHKQQQLLHLRPPTPPAKAAPAAQAAASSAQQQQQLQEQLLSALPDQQQQPPQHDSCAATTTELGQRQSQPGGCSSLQLLRHDTTNPATWRIDPATGARKLGVSVALMVGGIAEMFMIRKDHERIKLRDRKGFVRIAVEHGVDILPVYIFGTNQALDFGPPWLQRLSRRLRASLGVIYGVWGLPLPRRVPIFQVTGKPLRVGPPMRKDHPGFAARVDELHAQFCGEVERLYYAHRGKYGHGFENRPLVIC